VSTSAEDLRAIALTEFATAGYAGTSLHRIAEIAGLSKSSVLYHYESKERLLAAAVGPAIDRMEGILRGMSARPLTEASRRAFIVEFVDFLLEHRLEVHLFVNQAGSLVDVPVVDRANDLVVRLAEYFSATVASTEDRMRFGIALGGAASMLVTQYSLGLPADPADEVRDALIAIMTELLAPVTPALATPASRAPDPAARS
jgi:AcrR family transcriptional regulator